MNLQCDVIVWVEPEGRGRTQELRTMCPINLHEKSEAIRVAAESITRSCRCRVPLTRSSTHGVSALPSARSSSSFTKTYVASGFPHACQKSQSSNRDRAPRRVFPHPRCLPPLPTARPDSRYRRLPSPALNVRLHGASRAQPPCKLCDHRH